MTFLLREIADLRLICCVDSFKSYHVLNNDSSIFTITQSVTLYHLTRCNIPKDLNFLLTCLFTEAIKMAEVGQDKNYKHSFEKSNRRKT